MYGSGRKRSRGYRATAALAGYLLAAGAMTAVGGEVAVPSARLKHSGERFVVANAIRGAVRQLAHAQCEALLDEFADSKGRPLRVALEAQGVGVTEFLGRVLFYDAPDSACPMGRLAFTQAGCLVVFVCGRRFERVATESARYAEAAIIHEMLHSLGLGENPPSSDHISSRVMARCGRHRR